MKQPLCNVPKFVVTLILLCLFAPKAEAQYTMLYSSDYDLPNTLINKICEDKREMVWIATENALCRYNGSRFITYKNKKGDVNSLANNFVRSVCADKQGNVVVGSIGGAQIYRPLTDDFTEPFSSKADNIQALNVNDVCLLRDGSFLVVGGLCYTLTNVKGEWKVRPNILTKTIHDVFRAVELKDGSFLVASSPSGLSHVSKQGKVREIYNAQHNKFNIAGFCVAADGTVYVGSSDAGVYTYEAKTNTLKMVPGTEILNQVCDIRPLPGTNILCVATDGMGVRFFDTKTHQYVTNLPYNTQLVDINSQKAHTICFTTAGSMLIGLYQKGILMCARSTAAFNYIGSRSERYNLIDDRCVTSLLQTHEGNIWATTDNGGLFGFTSNLTSLRKYPADVKPNSVPATILGLFEDSKHRVWYGSYGRGGGIVDLSTGQCHNVLIKGSGNKDFNAYAYVEDKHGRVWLATMGNGVVYYDETQKVFVPYVPKNGRLLWGDCIFYDSQHDRIYCGTYDGVASFSPTDKTKTLKTVTSEGIAYSITRLSPDMLAFATNNGLMLYTISTGKLRTITTADGLPSDNVCAAQMGKNGLLWISTMSGLTRFNLKTMTAETFTYRDGLQGNEFYKNASIVTNDGRIWFGGINGITCFNPTDVNQNHITCNVRVVDIRAGEVYINADEEGNYTIGSGVEAFTVSFATLPIYMTHRVSYSYSVDGDEWELLAAPQNRVAFNNLGYGSHTLRVKTTVDGKDTEVSETRIYVRYPWYLKWWVVIIWLALLAYLIYYIQGLVRNIRRQRERERQHQQEEEMQESKLQFFMNVVHDLRTPLTLIATPLQKLKKNDADSARQHLYDIMGRNTDRLLRLTNEIMDLRKLDRGKMQVNLHRSLVSKHIRDIVETMSDIAETRHQQITLKDNTDGTQNMALDADNFEKILSNLLSNALKYTPEEGHVEVEWDITEDNDADDGNRRLELSVTDDGIGISDDEKRHIFERFYQVRINDKHVKGTGIGLNLVKALVELHKGEIKVSDNPAGKGTRFTVILPDNKDVKDSEPVAAYEPVSNETPAADASVTAESPVNESLDANGRFGKKMATILIVDDDDDIRNFLCEEMSGTFNVLESENGRAAYDVLNHQDVDLVVSDIMMPEVDGIELTKMIRKNIRLSHLPVILLTAKASDQDRIEGLQTTADAYVTKPFNLELLETLISNLLVRQEKLRNTFKGNEMPSDRIETPEMQSADDKLMERLLKVINENLANPDLTSEMLAREVGLSRVHMYRKLKELTNQSATNYIRNIRLTKAAELLRQNKTNISEVAYLVGFRTPTHFSTAFKELYGVSPKEYMNKE